VGDAGGRRTILRPMRNRLSVRADRDGVPLLLRPAASLATVGRFNSFNESQGVTMENRDRTQNQGGRTNEGGDENLGGRQAQGGTQTPGSTPNPNSPGGGRQGGGSQNPSEGGRDRQSGRRIGEDDDSEGETGQGGKTNQRQVLPSDDSTKTA
jgi:hypothetical protein